MTPFATLLLLSLAGLTADAATPEPPAIPEANDESAIEQVLGQANQLRSQRRYAEAERLYKDALATRSDSRRARAWNNLGALYYEQCRMDDAENAWRKSMALYEAEGSEDKLGLATAASNLGEIYRGQAKFALAEQYHQRAYRLRESMENKSAAAVAASLNTLGCLSRRSCFASSRRSTSTRRTRPSCITWPRPTGFSASSLKPKSC